ncbi:WecB/TagA/CpsF family glycosyltransferase [Candidatus Roizmanbacteria bacterium]|nr:WecB/TagA/CpsF family glycosyltransferase [Candidatus Roizmanbacteria bacterium]
MIDKKNILGVNLTNVTKKEVLEYIIKGLGKKQKKYFIVTPNPEFLVLANKNSRFKNILNSAELALPDGIGVILAGKILGKTLKQRITGIELLESLCSEIAEKPITVGFLGGGPGVADKTAERLQNLYPNLKIVFASEEWLKNNVGLSKRFKISDLGFKNKERQAINHKSSIINHQSIDMLFVAFGAPKQEIWISENLENLPVKIAIGVGGAFDYISGKVKRAPKFIQDLGLEWLYRLIRQPWRFKRQFSLLRFIWLVFKERIRL